MQIKPLIFKSIFASLVFQMALSSPALPQVADPLTKGVAVTDALSLKTLEVNGLGIGHYLGAPTALIANSTLSQLPSFQPIQTELNKDFAAYQTTHKGSGVGTHFSQRLFDPEFLSSGLARFVLTGIVNRMDRAYVTPGTCGEVRMIYRLAYRVQSQGEDVFSRLPMTINLVLGARPLATAGATPMTCAEVAQRWLNLNDVKNDLPALVANNPILRLETNLQIVRWPAAVRPDFGGNAEYLLKVFNRDQKTGVFSVSRMEDQIDRDALLKNPGLLQKFKAWLLQPEQLKNLDEGTLVIPDEFLAKQALSNSPGGLGRSENRPSYKLFSEAEINAQISSGRYDNLKSVTGFTRRLDELSCTGCHQTRAIGGFHLMGQDPPLKYPGNSVFIPASGHFFADLPRRRAIVNDFAQNRAPDFSNYFADRPQPKRSADLRGTGLMDGWGAHCSTGADITFNEWTCAHGLKCKILHDDRNEPGMGVCVPDGRQEIGDPLEAGTIQGTGYGQEKYVRTELAALPKPQADYVASPQSAQPGTSSGGFPGGMIRTKTCDNLPREAVCGALPAAKAGFNACVGSGKNFVTCIKEFAVGVGLRGCDEMNPCRDDYICSESYDKTRGACVPPYFLFQFRVDGHPVGHAG